jgi:hypothetical protein
MGAPYLIENFKFAAINYTEESKNGYGSLFSSYTSLYFKQKWQTLDE